MAGVLNSPVAAAAHLPQRMLDAKLAKPALGGRFQRQKLLAPKALRKEGETNQTHACQ
jgi:hypothetical protein